MGLSVMERAKIAKTNLLAVVEINKEQAKSLLKKKNLASMKAKVKTNATLTKQLGDVETALGLYDKELVQCRENMKKLKILTCKEADVQNFIKTLQQDRKDIAARYAKYKAEKAEAAKAVNDYLKAQPKEKSFFADLLTPDPQPNDFTKLLLAVMEACLK
jgi:hypothetical protein